MDESMLDRILPWAVLFLTIIAWPSAIILVRRAIRPPRVGALTERAIIAVLIAIIGTVATALAFAGDIRPLPTFVVVLWPMFQLALVALLAVPTYWTWLYLSGRLGSKA